MGSTRNRARARWPGLTLLAVVTLLLAAGTAWLAGLGPQGDEDLGVPAPVRPSAASVARGAYLATVGNCAACHTARGGLPWAGGRALATPFGTVYSGNLTPDAATGLGDWTAHDFWRALHHGRSRDGRFLLPAFPFAQYTRVTRADADDLWAYLRTLPPVRQAAKSHALRFPYGTPWAQAVWRALYFRPGVFQPEAGQSAVSQRGAYLVQGLGHCAACHAARNALGASQDVQALAGGDMPLQGWHAPALAGPADPRAAAAAQAATIALLKTGLSAQSAALGPMAEVVAQSTQHLHADDLQAIARHLQELPATRPASAAFESAPAAVLERGAAIYQDRCVDCHGEQGQGRAGAAGPVYPPLAGSRAVNQAAATNLIRVVLGGGFPPSTAGNPRPYGMPPYGQDLSDDDVAAVLSHIRQRWGNRAPKVSPLDVQRLR